MKEGTERFEVHATVGDHFAWLRTRLSIERTLMAWVRTATALIGFGFTIVQVFERFQSQADKPVLLPDAPRDLGLALIAAGVIGIAIAIYQYHTLLSYLWSGSFQGIAGISEKPHKTPLLVTAVLIGLVGIAAFGIVFFRIA